MGFFSNLFGDTDWGNVASNAATGAATGAAAGGVGAGIGAVIGVAAGAFGPGYNPAGGGEVKRQISAEGWPAGCPEAYYYYLQQFVPQLWQSGNIWNVPQTLQAGHPGVFRGRWVNLVAEGHQPFTFTVNPDGSAAELPTNASNGVGDNGPTKRDLKVSDVSGTTWVLLAGAAALLLWVLGVFDTPQRRRNGARKAARKGKLS